MTQDYRKRAEEFIDFINIRACDRNRFFMATYGEISNALETIFKQIDQESRHEENEACVRTIFLEAKWKIDPKIYEDLAQAIRSRMIGPEPMDGK